MKWQNETFNNNTYFVLDWNQRYVQDLFSQCVFGFRAPVGSGHAPAERACRGLFRLWVTTDKHVCIHLKYLHGRELFPVYNREMMNADAGPPCSAWQSEAGADCNLDLAAQILLFPSPCVFTPGKKKTPTPCLTPSPGRMTDRVLVCVHRPNPTFTVNKLMETFPTIMFVLGISRRVQPRSGSFDNFVSRITNPFIRQSGVQHITSSVFPVITRWITTYSCHYRRIINVLCLLEILRNELCLDMSDWRRRERRREFTRNVLTPYLARIKTRCFVL